MDPVTEPHPSPSNSNYAFITHSQETLPRNLPPSIDNANLARRRRRRTSVHDQAILEEEYRICDRPDKTRRKEISSRVQMGEKEVQIWFQNKRQSARRKAKPLLPHEIIPNTTTTTTNNSNNNSSQQSSSQQEEYSQQGMMMPSSSQYSSFDNSQQSLSREDIRHMSTSFNSDSHQHRRRRCVSVSSGIDFGSPQPQCLADRGSFSSDVSASQESARSKSQPIYLGLSDADPDEDFDDDDDIGEEEAEEEELRLRGRNTVESPHHHLPQHRYEPSYYSKRQKLSSRDNHLLALLQQSSPPTTSSIPTQESQHQQNPSLSSRNDQPEPEMTTSAHQRLQDVLSSMQEIISSSSTPAKPTFTNSRRTNANPNANPNPGHNPNPNPTPTTPRLLKRTSSIRLSTSLEGKATIVLDEEPESPPSSQQTLPTPKKPSPIASSGPPRKIVDSKIWEFYCDNQAMIRSPATHASLQTAAEAKEALGLLRRKNSHNSKLPPTLPQSSPVAHRKRGGKLAQPSSPTKAKKSRKILSAKLSRSKAVPVAKKSGSGKKLVDGLPSELGQESDKENRPPGAPVSPPPEPRGRSGKGEAKKAPAEKPSRKRKRNTIAADERRILEDHKTIPSQTSAVYDVPSSSQPIDNFRSDGPGLDEHEMMLSQRSFSNYFTSSQESGPAVMDEMECVENLLSLRGGTWR